MNYPLRDVARFVTDGDRKIGLHIRCPKCQMRFGCWFKNPIGGGQLDALRFRVQWDRTGETLEALSLTPSFMAVGHFHSWVRNGELQVDSAFTCPVISLEPVA